jgi:hypothetical protein
MRLRWLERLVVSTLQADGAARRNVDSFAGNDFLQH